MKNSIIIIAFLILGQKLAAQDLKTDISVHDPVIIKQDSVYYVFCTGNGITNWSSVDKVHWKREKPVFAAAPAWVKDFLPEFRNYIWAPDISYYKGQYYLFYSVSAFGKNKSAIGMATNTTLHASSADYKWVDHGQIIRSVPGQTNWNAIDPNLVDDGQGNPYLVFGSFWDGIKLVKLQKDRLSLAGDIATIPTIASRKRSANAIEAPFIFKHDKYYYLFASIDYCCQGPKSTYKMIIGRAENIRGPYLDKDGVAMSDGGGSILLEGDKDWYGVGHNGVATFDGADYIIFHGYDAADRAIPKLRLARLNWVSNWPDINKNDLTKQ